jgi:hypothetical protein
MNIDKVTPQKIKLVKRLKVLISSSNCMGKSELQILGESLENSVKSKKYTQKHIQLYN